MSGIIDMWTCELAKLREKGQTLFPSGSSHVTVESSQADEGGPQERNSSGSSGGGTFISRVMGLKPPAVKFSEGSVSMLVQWFSP
ncbi:hypothetical protein SLA2020_170490 [Shorea laevis]